MLEETQHELTAENVSEAFRRLASQWKKETSHHSAISQRKKHPAYQAILRLGAPAIPLIIRELRQKPALWVDALCSLTGEDPVREADVDNPQKMADST